ncbi:MAG TPA: DMT family transporter [Aestuariivirga sp.]
MAASGMGENRASQVKGMTLVAIATIVWASGGLFTRLLPFDLWTIVFWRGVFATLFIGAYVLYCFGRSTFAVVWGAGFEGFLVAVFSAATIILFPAAFLHTSVANAFTIITALPFVTAAIAWLWMRERPSMATMVASGFALLGIVIMLGPTAGGPQLGDLLAVLGTISQALMTVIIRRNPDVKMVPMAWASIVLSVVISYPLAEHLWDLTARDYLVAAGFGLGPMTLGMMLYMIGSGLIPSTLTALINTMEAPIGALWAWVGVGEVPAVETIIGGGIVLASVFGRLLGERPPADKVSEMQLGTMQNPQARPARSKTNRK